jgi:nicotinamidase-related amidase
MLVFYILEVEDSLDFTKPVSGKRIPCQQLKTRGVDTVVLTGISTNHGVESTARQGTGLGFAFVLVEDACAGLDAEEHRFAFEKIFPRLARIRATDEVIAALV